MEENNKGKTLHSLRDLGVMVLTPVLNLPEISPSLSSLEALEEQAEMIRGGAEKIGDWVKNILPTLENLKRGASREAKELVTEKVLEAEATLEGFLWQDPTPAYRRAAWLEVCNYEFSKEIHSQKEAEILLGQLVNKGYLVEDPAGILRAYGKTYTISSESFFEAQEIAETRWKLKEFLDRVNKTESKSLFDQSNISLEEFLNGKAGKFVLDIPPEEVKNPDGITAFWRGGGTLLVKSDGEKIFPCLATVSLQKVIKELRRMTINNTPLYLFLTTLKKDKPPFLQKIPEEENKKVQLLWFLLKRGLHQLEEREKIRAQGEEFGTEATTSPKEWFLKQKSGICLVKYEGDWENPDGTRAKNLFFLIKRVKEKGIKRICLVKVPDHLKEFFAKCMDEYPEEGNKYEESPYPLKAVLQAVYGQINKSVLITQNGK